MSQVGGLPTSPLGDIGGIAGADPVAQEIDFLREQRMRMVERIEQCELVYEALRRTMEG